MPMLWRLNLKVDRNAMIRGQDEPLQKLAIAVSGIGGHGLGLPSLPLGEASNHILCGHRLLAHAGRGRLYPYNYTAAVVDQVVVVVTQSRRSSALGRTSRVRIGGGHLRLLMHGLFGWVLLLQFHQILSCVVFYVRHDLGFCRMGVWTGLPAFACGPIVF